jgi:hypothetical protein
LSDYVAALQARTLWGRFDHGADLIATLAASVAEGREIIMHARIGM